MKVDPMTALLRELGAALCRIPRIGKTESQNRTIEMWLPMAMIRVQRSPKWEKPGSASRPFSFPAIPMDLPI
jgi:hypothetical protein